MIDELILNYAKEIKDLDIYKEMKELDKIIKEKYFKLIINFKTKESNYLDAISYKDYCKDFQNIKDEFINAKSLLYSKEEVKKYFKLENELNNLLADDFNELKKAISNKFHLTKIINI